MSKCIMLWAMGGLVWSYSWTNRDVSLGEGLSMVAYAIGVPVILLYLNLFPPGFFQPWF